MPTVADSPAESILVGVSCITTSFCIAVGYAYFSGGSTYTSLIEQWNGTAWSVVQGTVAPTSDNYLEGVSCTSTTFCMAGGGVGNSSMLPTSNSGTARRGRQRPSILPPEPPARISTRFPVRLPQSCMAVGTENVGHSTPFAEQWNGSAWAATSVPAVSLAGIRTRRACRAQDHLSAPPSAGNADVNVVNTWNGSSWALARSPRRREEAASSESAASAQRRARRWATAVRQGSAPQALTWDGQTWTEATTPAGPPSSTATEYNAVDCVTDWACVAAGGSTVSSNNFLPVEVDGSHRAQRLPLRGL